MYWRLVPRTAASVNHIRRLPAANIGVLYGRTGRSGEIYFLHKIAIEGRNLSFSHKYVWGTSNNLFHAEGFAAATLSCCFLVSPSPSLSVSTGRCRTGRGRHSQPTKVHESSPQVCPALTTNKTLLTESVEGTGHCFSGTVTDHWTRFNFC